MRAHETSFGFFQRVDDPACGRIRDLLNGWFARFAGSQDAEAVADLRGRFRAKEDGQFDSAFWELYLHEAFSRLGFEIAAHPDSERGTKPDFALTRGTDRLYVEAVAPQPGFSSRNEPRNVQMVIEHVNEAFHPDFLLRLRFVRARDGTPRKVAVRKAVSDALHALQWEAVWKGDMSESERDIEVDVGDGWKIGLTALPLPPESRGRPPGPMIFSYKGGVGYPDALGPAMVPTLYEKANKYGDLDAPHVVAIWVIDLMASQDTAALALFGSWFEMEDGTHRTGLDLRSRPREGIWSPGAKHRGRASAVLATSSFEFGYPAVARTLPRLWPNPWADRPLNADLPFPSSTVSADEATVLNRPAAVAPPELFELPEGWPGQPFRDA